MRLNELSWVEFERLDIDQRAACFAENGKPVHLLVAQQFDRSYLDMLGHLATRIRFLAKSKEGALFLMSLLQHKHAMLYFSQPSTRTFLSFLSACQILGMNVGNVRDTATSSEFKGESQEDSVRTFSSYFDIVIMRTKEQGLATRMAWVLSNSERPIPIINAGSGSDQHPTQALLDIYTLQRSFEKRGGIDGKRVIFVGDLARGRTVRSLSILLAKYNNVEQCFVAPDSFQIGDDVRGLLSARGVKYELSNDLKKQIPVADAIYMTRVQDEWDKVKGESAKVDTSKYRIGPEQMALLKKDAVIMHPLPRRNEISPEIDHDPRAVYWRQMRNGMWIRAALIAHMFDCDQSIHDYADNNC